MLPQERHDRAAKYIEAVALTGFEEANPRELSGGMKQREVRAFYRYEQDLIAIIELNSAPAQSAQKT